MKSHIHILPILFLVLLCVIMISGCSSNTSSSTVTIVPTITPQTGANPAFGTFYRKSDVECGCDPYRNTGPNVYQPNIPTDNDLSCGLAGSRG